MGIVAPISEGCCSSKLSEVYESKHRAQYVARTDASSCLLLFILAKACWWRWVWWDLVEWALWRVVGNMQAERMSHDCWNFKSQTKEHGQGKLERKQGMEKLPNAAESSWWNELLLSPLNSHHYFWVSWNWRMSMYFLKAYCGHCQKVHRTGDLQLQSGGTILGPFMEQAQILPTVPTSRAIQKSPVYLVLFVWLSWKTQTRKREEMEKDGRHMPFAHVTNPGIPD